MLLTLTLTPALPLTHNIIAAMSQSQMTPQQAVAVYNPMNPQEDVDEQFFWRATASNHGKATHQDVMDSMYKDKFEYTSTVAVSQNGTSIIHMFRRKRSSLIDQDNHVEKLRLQVEALKLKIESDKLQIEMAKMIEERAAALKVLAESGISLVDQQD